MSIRRHPVSSSQIKSIGYDPTTKSMDVEFNNSGRVYRYHDVPPEKHAALMAADSIGSHLSAHIKGAHRYERLPERNEAES